MELLETCMPQDFLSQLVGSFAKPAAENPTVAMMEAAFRHHKMDWRYINCEVHPHALRDAVRGARAMGWRGFNCSVPHKVAVIEHLDGLGQSAEIMQAVNTVVRRDDRLIGENTDGQGFVKAMREVIDPLGKSVVLFGAGGAARAVSVEMALAGASKITVVNRTRERGRGLVDLLNSKTSVAASLEVWDSTYSLDPMSISSSTPPPSVCFPTSMGGLISMCRVSCRGWSLPTVFTIRHEPT